MFKLLVFIAILAYATGSDVNKRNLREIHDVSELSLTERLLTLYMAQTNPHYKNISHQFLNISLLSPSPQAYTIFDETYLEFGTFVLASRHWGETNLLPEINWKYGLSWCWCLWGSCSCVDQAHSWISKDSKFLGTDTIKMTTDWTPNTFVHRFTIGNYTWWSPEGTTIYEDFINRGIVTCKGFWAKLENVSFLAAGAYHHDETLGLQVDTLTIEVKAGNISAGQNGCIAKWIGDEESVEYEPILFDVGEGIVEEFEKSRMEILNSLRTRLNCVLSEGKYVPPTKAGDDWSDECNFKNPKEQNFMKMATVQLFQMMAAGSQK